MKFQFIISKWANFYLFISNISEWHFSVRKNYNIIWREELGKFSDEEEYAIKQFKEIRQNYSTSRSFFEEAFFIAKNPFDVLQKHLPVAEYDIIKQIFNILENKFNILYNKDLPFLEKWQEKLASAMNDSSIVNSISSTLSMLYNIQISEKEITVYILLSDDKQTGGGANIDDKSISIEVSRYPLQIISHALGIIWHETIHLVFEKQYFKNLIEQHYPGLEEQGINIREITATLLFPRGILGQKFLNNAPPGPSYLGRLGHRSNDLFSLIMQYANQNKKLDISYIKNIVEIVQK